MSLFPIRAGTLGTRRPARCSPRPSSSRRFASATAQRRVTKSWPTQLRGVRLVPRGLRDLDEGEWWLARIERAGIRSPAMQAGLLALHPWLLDGARAQNGPNREFTQLFDGLIGEPAPDADPRRTRRPMSSFRLRERPFAVRFFARSSASRSRRGRTRSGALARSAGARKTPSRGLSSLPSGTRGRIKPTVTAHRGLIESIAED